MVTYLELAYYGDLQSCIGRPWINANTPQGSRILDRFHFFGYSRPVDKIVLVDVHSIQLATPASRLNTWCLTIQETVLLWTVACKTWIDT